jgi:hemoglobin-like flavoprotein
MEITVKFPLKSVLQKALAFAHEPYFSTLIKAIVPQLEKLKHHFPFGNKLYIKLINSYPELQNSKTIEPSNNENANSYLANQTQSFATSINKRINKRNYQSTTATDSQKGKSNKFSSNYYK